jgi:hypothetical protein
MSDKRASVRNNLRNYGILPPYGEPMNDEQQLIWNQIKNNDFTYWENIKKNKKNTDYWFGKKKGNTIHGKSRIKNHPEHKQNDLKIARRLYDLREVGILPELNTPLNNEQQALINFVKENPNTSRDKLVVNNKHLTSLEKYLWFKTKKRIYKSKTHRKRNIILFNIEPNDIFIPKYCPYLNLELKFDGDSCDPAYYNIDRINSQLGYVKGNVQVISQLANTMKNNATIDELIIFATNVLKLHNT